jgi:hypothetical protein
VGWPESPRGSIRDTDNEPGLSFRYPDNVALGCSPVADLTRPAAAAMAGATGLHGI